MKRALDNQGLSILVPDSVDMAVRMAFRITK